ncbi:hypothetical protein ASC94_09155 [Massilia sp. Root418]|uniref:hypothetical protein n=1 Tax=Massilia sp. Root418 TaxID=1736532 RepID=UPI0006FA139A|nr:hypothetical protein [Massilia sp. Root418]KQW96964.1 hypothetical protein ASC94_09155 [Massilia sp. Root418]
MPVNVRGAVAALTSQMQGGQKQVDFATRVALTRTAQAAVPALQREMRDVFRNPTPYTLSGLRVVPATKTRLAATVMLKDDATKATPAAKYLLPQIKGGQRGQKRFERALQAVGAMPAGYRAVPGSGARLDAFGNMSRGQIVQLLAYFRAFPEAGYKANMTADSRARLARGTKRKQGYAYFVGRPGDRLPLGIYQRVGFGFGSAIKPVLLFVRSAVYTERFDFEYVVRKTVETEFAGEFARAMVEAERTAR